MPGGESDSQRPIADGADGLSELRDREVPAAVGEVAEHVRAELAELRRLLEQARGHVDPAMLTALDDAHRRLQDDLQRLGGDVSGVLSSAAGELDALRRPSPRSNPAPVVASPSAPRRPVDDAVTAVRAALAGPHPDVAALVARVLADTAHSLDLTRALRDPERRGGALAILGELADGRALAGRSLDDYVAAHPGRGPLFAPVPSDALAASDGRSRKERFVAAAVLADPGRGIGADPTPEQLDLLDDYVRRLVEDVEPRVFAELSSLAGAYPGAAVSSRVKDPDGLVEKVRRMSAGANNRPGRPGYRVGDVLDAVGARITVGGTADLAALVGAVVERFGTDDDGSVLDWENRYTDPKPHNPAYRVVPFILVARVGGLAYPFELQLTTQRTSVAADLEHNTVYKPYVPVSDQEGDRIRGMQAEAAALDQDETRNGVD